MFKCTAQSVAVLLAMILFSPAPANAAEFHGRLAGTQFNTDYDTNEDGFAAANIQGTGRFTHLGKMTANGANEVYWDGASFCPGGELEMDTYYFHMVLSGESGDMLFTEQTSGGVLCWNPGDASWTATHPMQIVGGTGKFSQATGHFDCDNAGKPLFNPDFLPIGYTWEAECQGENENIGQGD
jgi:hypothetical protein